MAKNIMRAFSSLRILAISTALGFTFSASNVLAQENPQTNAVTKSQKSPKKSLQKSSQKTPKKAAPPSQTTPVAAPAATKAAPLAAPAAAAATSAQKPLLSARGSAPREADRIVAIVNSDPITLREVERRTQRVLQNLREAGNADIPSAAQLAPQVLEQLILEKAQVQHAKEIGLSVEDYTVEQAAARIAAQNGLSADRLDVALAAEGIDPATFRHELREQILMQRLRERELEARVQVSDQDVAQYLQDQPAQASEPQLTLAHLLIEVPEGADAASVSAARARAQAAIAALGAGQDLASVAQEYGSSAQPVMPMRPLSRYPQLFAQAVAQLDEGQIVPEPLRSGAGFHVLQVLEREQGAALPTSVTQTRASHILLRPTPTMDERATAARLGELRQRIVRGMASFEQIAREHSQDGSAEGGGDLGWAMPGQFVPEFEQVMNALEPGQISEVVLSRFGLHLIRVDERRQARLTPEQQRQMLHNVVREQKLEKAQAAWLEELRARAWVEYRNDE